MLSFAQNPIYSLPSDRKESTALRYQCLVLDHDDTVTDSTAHVHYPAFQDAMRQMRPGVSLSLEDYLRVNFDPGFHAYCAQTLRFTEADFEREYGIWQGWVQKTVPQVFPGMVRLIRRFTEAGGLVCVVSHSVDFNIRRDYRENGLPEPYLVYGWEQPKEHRKPEPWPLDQIMEKTGLPASQLLMVDDLKPGLDMAQKRGVDFAAALWAYDVPEIHGFMRRHSPLCFDTPEALEAFVMEDQQS